MEKGGKNTVKAQRPDSIDYESEGTRPEAVSLMGQIERGSLTTGVTPYQERGQRGTDRTGRLR